MNFIDVPFKISQGGHLSSLLFCLFVHSISRYIMKAQFLLYTDDIKIFYKIESQAGSFILQEELVQFSLWVSQLSISLNLSKCSVISFSRSRNPTLYSYQLCGSLLQQVSLIKDLVIYNSSNLSINHHIDFTVGKTIKVLGFIKHKTRLFRSVQCICSLYVALVRSLLEYRVII